MPVQAAKCLKEAVRSHRFLTGIKQAIDDTLQQNDCVELLYAGSGPWGSIVIPLLHFYKPEQLQITLLDIHQTNIDSISRVIEGLNLQDFFKEISLADATKWKPEKQEHKFDIVVSETMNNMLKREPQVAIFAHLQQFLTDSGSLIPEAVRVQCWAQSAKATDSKQIKVKDLFVLDKASAKEVREKQLSDINGQFTLPADISLPCHLEFATVIDVYKDITLAKNECSLNISVHRNNISPVQGAPIFYTYHINQSPDWQFDYHSQNDVAEIISTKVKSANGLMHMQRFWDKYRRMSCNDLDPILNKKEVSLDQLLMKTLDIPLHESLSYVATELPEYEEFEAWVAARQAEVSDSQIEEFNHVVASHTF